jgi:hypothetical protein
VAKEYPVRSFVTLIQKMTVQNPTYLLREVCVFKDSMIASLN